MWSKWLGGKSNPPSLGSVLDFLHSKFISRIIQKSTIVSLLQRFYDPIDGINIKGINMSSLREQIGVVSQEPKLFATSIQSNIAYGNPDATNAQIKEAARLANAHSFIESFLQGYDTLVGDRGAQISGKDIIILYFISNNSSDINPNFLWRLNLRRPAAENCFSSRSCEETKTPLAG